jgi:tape measure domain-containing protein
MADTSIVVKLIDETRAGFQSINSNLDGLDRSTSALTSSFNGLKTAAAAFVGVVASRATIDFIDTIQTMDNRLKLVTKSQGELNSTFNDLFTVSQKTRSPLTETVDLYSKLAQNQSVSKQSTDDLKKVTEAFTTSLAISGTSGQAAAGAIMQFAQAMGKGTLDGDEFRAMAEANPKVLAVLSEQTGIAREQLKKLGSEGFLSAEIAAIALKQALPDLQKEMANTDVTVRQAITQMSNEFQKLGRDFLDSSGTSKTLVEAIQYITDNMTNLIPIIKLVGIALAAAFVFFAPWTAALGAAAAAVVYFSDKLGPIAQTILDAFGKALEMVVPKLAGVGAALLALANLENPFTAYTKASEESSASFVKNQGASNNLKDATTQLGDEKKKTTGVTDEMTAAMAKNGLTAALTQSKYGDYIKTLQLGLLVADQDKGAKDVQIAVTKALELATEDAHKKGTVISAERKQQITQEVTSLVEATTKKKDEYDKQVRDQKQALDDAIKLLQNYSNEYKKNNEEVLSSQDLYTKQTQEIEKAHNTIMSQAKKLSAEERTTIETNYQNALKQAQTSALSDLYKEYKKYTEDNKTEETSYRDKLKEIDMAYRLAIRDNAQLSVDERQKIEKQHQEIMYAVQTGSLDKLYKQYKTHLDDNKTNVQLYVAAVEEIETAYRRAMEDSASLSTTQIAEIETKHRTALLGAQSQYSKDIQKIATEQRNAEMTATEKYADAIQKLNEAQNAGLITSQETYDLNRRKIEKDYRDATATEYSNLYGVLTSKIQEFTGLNSKEFGLLKDTVKLVFGVDIDQIIKQAFAEFIKYIIGFRQAGDSEIGLFTGIFSKIFGKSGSGAKDVGDFASESTGILKGFGTSGEGIFSSIGSIISSVFSGGLGVISKFASSAFDILKGLGGSVGDIFGSIGNVIGDLFGGSGGGGGILDTITSFGGSLVDTVSGFFTGGSGIMETITSGLGSFGSVLGAAGLAAGGIGIITAIGDALGLDKFFGTDPTSGAGQEQAQRGFESNLAAGQAKSNALTAYQANVMTPGTKEAANSVLMTAQNFVNSYGPSAEGFYHWILGKSVPPSAPKMEFARIQNLAFQATGKQYTKEEVPKSLYFALGGVINRKTMFPMQGGDIGVAGEAGAEAILPLSRGSNGELGVQGGGPVNISFTINAIDSRGIDQLLVERRQFITNMVRSATAERGRKVF